MDVRDPSDYPEEEAEYSLTAPDSPDEVAEVPLEDVPPYAYPALHSSERAMMALEAAAASDAPGLLGLRSASWRLRNPYDRNPVARTFEKLLATDDVYGVSANVFYDILSRVKATKSAHANEWIGKNPYRRDHLDHILFMADMGYHLLSTRYGGKIVRVEDDPQGPRFHRINKIYYLKPAPGYDVPEYRMGSFTDPVVFIMPDGTFITSGIHYPRPGMNGRLVNVDTIEAPAA